MKELKKTIIICITAIICTAMLSYAYLQSNRYYVRIEQGVGIVDKYNGSIKAFTGGKWNEYKFEE